MLPNMSPQAFMKLCRRYMKVSVETPEESKERFSFDPCVEIRPSTHGNGVFATRDIKKGDIITYYPAHYIQITSFPLILTKPEYTKGDKPNDEYLYTSIKGNYSITGHPRLTDNPYMLGHIVNDPCDEVFKREDETFGKWVGRYLLTVSMKRNSRFTELDSGLIAITALKDIKKDEEILIAYDIQYWGMKNGFIKDGETLKGLLNRLISEIGKSRTTFLWSLMSQ